MKRKTNKPTWDIHYVFDEDWASCHTHGLNKYGSLELEINLPIQQELAGYILNEIGFMIANKEIELKDGDIIEEVTNVGLVVFETEGVHSGSHEGEKNVFRIVIPDEKMKFPWDEDCNITYKKQIELNKKELD